MKQVAALLAGLIAALLATGALAQTQITPFSGAAPGAPPAPWRRVTLPKIPRHTEYSIEREGGTAVLRARANASYANLVHPLTTDTRSTPWLAWRWKVDQVPAHADLLHKAGDDLAAKLCVLFDLPLDRLSAADRWKIRLGRSLFDPDLPAATLCYVWDRQLAPGTVLPNIYTDRVRFIVLRSAAATPLGVWQAERRNLVADFAFAFGREAEGGVPPITGVALAADADNTGDAALAWFGDIRLETP